MNSIKSHEDLIAWQKGQQLTLDVFRIVNQVDPVLFEFMKESALTVVSEIAVGYNLSKQQIRLQHLEKAKSSTARLSTQIILTGELQFISKERSELLYAQALEVGKIISGLIKCIKTIEHN